MHPAKAQLISDIDKALETAESYPAKKPGVYFQDITNSGRYHKKYRTWLDGLKAFGHVEFHAGSARYKVRNTKERLTEFRNKIMRQTWTAQP